MNNAAATLAKLQAKVDGAYWSAKFHNKTNFRPEFEVGMGLCLASYRAAGSTKYFSQDRLGLSGAMADGFNHAARALMLAESTNG